MAEQILAARNAILDRMEETLGNPIPTEHRAMNDALRNLRRLTSACLSKTAKEYDKRSSRITHLLQELERLEAARTMQAQRKVAAA